MGAPWFQIKHLQAAAGLVALSANFPLYGDMSDRMMSIAAGLGPVQEIYSIDESFRGQCNRYLSISRSKSMSYHT